MATIWAQHTITGAKVQVGSDIPEHYLQHPVFGQFYVVIDSPEECVTCGEEEAVTEEVTVEEDTAEEVPEVDYDDEEVE